MKIQVHLLSQSQPIKYEGVVNAYTKDGLYCIYTRDGNIDKFPLVNIFRITETKDPVTTISVKEVFKFGYNG